MNVRLTTLAFAAMATAAGLACAQAPVKTANGMMVNTSGMTLYTFDSDAGGKSACNGGCAALWPPLTAAADAKADGDMTIITRDDGSRQWSYKGKPLYNYKPDAKAGDATGDNFRNVWHVIKR